MQSTSPHPAFQPLEPRQLLAAGAAGAGTRAAELRGSIWSDTDADQLREAGEPALPDVVVFLDDRVRDGKLGKHERRTRTDADGNYVFTNVPPGRHVVAVQRPNDATPSWPAPPSQFDIHLVFDRSTTPRERDAFTRAAAVWEKIIVGDVRNVGGHVDDVEIEIKPSGSELDDDVIMATSNVGVRKVAPDLPFQSLIVINEDLRRTTSRELVYRTALHELAHALGFGLLWEAKKLTRAGSGNAGTTYTGPRAVAQYKTLFKQSGATSVPLNTTGGDGTADLHWADSFVDDDGLSELMRGGANNQSVLRLSTLTVGALEDLGYAVNYRAADPFAGQSPSLFRDRNPDEVITTSGKRHYRIKLQRGQTRRRLDFGFAPKTLAPPNR